MAIVEIGRLWACAACLCATMAVAVARNDGRYDNSPNRDWFTHLQNNMGIPCCDVADGRRLEDADWRSTSDGHYEVKIDGAWRTVPDSAVINPKNRPIDFAVVWVNNSNVIECFMVGSGM